MGYVALSFLVAFAALVVRTRVERSDRSVSLCDNCGYDLAGLDREAHCPECDGVERRPVAPDRTIVEFVRWRAAFLGASIVAWVAMWLAHASVAHSVILERMIRAGFDPYAANVWISRNSADAVVFDSTNAKALHTLALVCAGVSPWLALLPPRWAWWAMAGVILCGASAVVLAYVAV
jgi:hypothetical protein